MHGGDVVAHRRLRFIYSLFVLAFVIFTVRTLWLGIQGTDRSRIGASDGAWVVNRADIVDHNGGPGYFVKIQTLFIRNL